MKVRFIPLLRLHVAFHDDRKKKKERKAFIHLPTIFVKFMLIR